MLEAPPPGCIVAAKCDLRARTRGCRTRRDSAQNVESACFPKAASRTANTRRSAMTTPAQRTRIAKAIAGITLGLAAGPAFSAAFALQENSGSGLGNAYAGGPAAAEDAAPI